MKLIDDTDQIGTGLSTVNASGIVPTFKKLGQLQSQRALLTQETKRDQINQIQKTLENPHVDISFSEPCLPTNDD